MHDPRLDTLADLLIKHSTRLEQGEKILIETFDIPEDMVIALIRAARKVGGVPLVSCKQNRIQRELIQAGQEEAMQTIGECETYRMEQVQAYEVADNGNRSSVHWDMVMIQTPAYGGGKIYFDGKLVRKNGLFVLPELLNLNPENLK